MQAVSALLLNPLRAWQLLVSPCSVAGAPPIWAPAAPVPAPAAPKAATRKIKTSLVLDQADETDTTGRLRRVGEKAAPAHGPCLAAVVGFLVGHLCGLHALGVAWIFKWRRPDLEGSGRSVIVLRLHHLAGAFLEVGLLGERVGLVEGQLVH